MSVWITAALTGGVLTRADTPHLPVTPAEIAADALACAAEGAAMVHIHVRDPATGGASHDTALYVEVADRIRARDADLLIHFTGGGGGTLTVALAAPAIAPAAAAAILPPEARLAHLGPARADLTGLDCGSFSYGRGGDVYLAPTDLLHRSAAHLAGIGVRPELTVFDLGHMALAAEMIAGGLVPPRTPVMIGFGVVWGAPARPSALAAMLDLLPPGTDWGAHAKGEAGQAVIAPLAAARGGGLRTGIEDHHLLGGAPVRNAVLVARARETLVRAGAAPLDARALRRRLGLPLAA